MYEENIVLCGCNGYEKKYYLNEDFASLPDAVKDEIKAMCVLYTEDVGGILTLQWDAEGTLFFQVESEEGDLLFDEIGSGLKIKQIQIDKAELLEALEFYYKTLFLDEED